MSQQMSLVEIARMRRAARQAQAANPNNHVRPKVLFVDDEERILRSMTALFRDHYDVTVTTDGNEALELLRQHRFATIVSDQRMPIMPGIEVLRHAREISPDTTRILLTGFADLAAIVGSVNESEVYRYLRKPWNNDELRDTVREATEIHQKLVEAKECPKASARLDMMQEVEDEVSDILEAYQPPPKPAFLFVESDGSTYESFLHETSGDYDLYKARNSEEALRIMAEVAIAAVVVAIDERGTENIDFIYLLKQRHPEISIVVLCEFADSELIVELINSARILRILFRPVKNFFLHHTFEMAATRAENVQENPTLLETQRTARRRKNPVIDAIASRLNISAKLNQIKSFLTGR